MTEVTLWACRAAAALSVGSLLVCGCAPSPRATDHVLRVSANGEHHATLLLSEVLAAGDRRALLPTEFRINNVSGRSQSIALASKSCSCYAVLIEGDRLEVGGSFLVRPDQSCAITLDVAAPTEPGSRNWRAVLHARDDLGETADVPVTLTAQVIDDAILEPGVITVTETQQATVTAGARIVRTYRGHETVTDPDIVGLPEGCRVDMTRRKEGPRVLDEDLREQSWNLVMKFPINSIPPGAIHQFETVFASHAAVQPIIATGRILREDTRGISVPEVVHFGRIAIGETRRKRVAVIANDGRAFRITERVDGPASMNGGKQQVTSSARSSLQPLLEMQVDFDPQRTALQHLIELEWTAAKAGPLEGAIVLATDHPQCPRLELHVCTVGVAAAGGD